jgi:hypothetical protein
MSNDPEKQKIFLKEILSVQSKLNENDSEKSASSRKFAKDFVEGFAENNPFVDAEKLNEIQKNYSLEDIVEELKDYNLVDQIDQIIAAFSGADINHEGRSIDGSIFKEKWEELKSKYKAYNDSEDINNL